MGIVDDTLTQWRRSRFIWGETDCVMAVANYVLALTGNDPAATWRGRYHDEAGARALYDLHGGVQGIVRFGLRGIGIHEGLPAYGRPVVCRVGDHEVAGLCLGPRVAFMAERGVVEGRAEVLAAWAP